MRGCGCMSCKRGGSQHHTDMLFTSYRQCCWCGGVMVLLVRVVLVCTAAVCGWHCGVPVQLTTTTHLQHTDGVEPVIIATSIHTDSIECAG